MKKDNLVYIDDIFDCTRKILKFTKNMSFDEFLASDITLDAVLRNFEIIGEAAKQLSEEFVADNPEFPIAKAIAMRNFLIHEYKKINFDLIWSTIKNDLPTLKKQVKKILAK